MDSELTIEQQDELKKLRAEAECEKQPMLCIGNYQDLPKVRKAGSDELLECLNERAFNCPQALPYGPIYFCRCPARAYLYRKFGI